MPSINYPPVGYSESRQKKSVSRDRADHVEVLHTFLDAIPEEIVRKWGLKTTLTQFILLAHKSGYRKGLAHGREEVQFPLEMAEHDRIAN